MKHIKYLDLSISDFGHSSLTGWFAENYLKTGDMLCVDVRLYLEVKIAARGCISDDINYLRKTNRIGKNCVVQISAHVERN